MKIYTFIFNLMFIILLSCGHSDSKLTKDEKKDSVSKSKLVEINEDSVRIITKEARKDSIFKNQAISKNENQYPWLMPTDYTPLTFIKTFSTYDDNNSRFNWITMLDQFPNKWVKRVDIDTLVTLIKSTKKCKCFLNPLSSRIPNDSANIGGYAIKFINSYRNKSKLEFGLYDCPKTDAKSVEEINQWWSKYRQEK